MQSNPPLPVTPADFRSAMSRWASGVAVVAVRDVHGVSATTVSSFSALSLEPPLVMLALTAASRTLERIGVGERFTVSVLSAEQREIAVQCASGAAEDAAFDESALVRGCLTGVSCAVYDLRLYGDHQLLVGRVVGMLRRAEGEPLLYWNRAYRAIAAAAPTGVEAAPR